MSRASVILATLAFATIARADEVDEPHAIVREHVARSHETIDPRAELVDQLAAETATIDRTIATVAGKLSAADTIRLHRLHAAIRILHAPLTGSATADERMAAARRRAAARLLIERDAAERNLLAVEADHLRAAQHTTSDATAKLPTITLPDELGWPARGKIARHFGELQHERSKATLSRRGLDLEVDDHVDVGAPADGTIRYAGPIRGLDSGVILDHGDYLTVIAKLGELAIPVGTHVKRGEHVGRSLHHRVYLEVRVNVGPGGLPIDPEPLLTR